MMEKDQKKDVFCPFFFLLKFTLFAFDSAAGVQLNYFLFCS